MRDQARYTPGELIRLLSADVRTLAVILERHRNRLTPVETAVLDAIGREHGIEPEGIQG